MMAFEVMCKKHIARLLDPSLRCVEQVAAELNGIIQRGGEKVGFGFLGVRIKSDNKLAAVERSPVLGRGGPAPYCAVMS